MTRALSTSFKLHLWDLNPDDVEAKWNTNHVSLALEADGDIQLQLSCSLAAASTIAETLLRVVADRETDGLNQLLSDIRQESA